GRPVKMVVSDRMTSAGMTTLTWDGRNAGGLSVPSGTYLVRITAAGSDGSVSRSIGTVNLQR
ncbi:MAG: hypothetical protein J7M38_06135, partial [Armatimonadetes bacterium]|nr:hypothetical protein [Armatimonadota bacterium]